MGRSQIAKKKKKEDVSWRVHASLHWDGADICLTPKGTRIWNLAFPAERPVLRNDSLSRNLVWLRERTYSQNELVQLAKLFKISCSYNAWFMVWWYRSWKLMFICQFWKWK